MKQQSQNHFSIYFVFVLKSTNIVLFRLTQTPCIGLKQGAKVALNFAF